MLVHSYKAFKEHSFPRLIELCGTSNALEALVEAHSEDDMPLHVLCCRKFRKLWNKELARIERLPAQAAVAELISQDEFGVTAFAVASVSKAPVEVLESMILLGKLDSEKRNVLDIVDIDLRLPLHHTAKHHPDPAVTKLLVRHHPSALLVKDRAAREHGHPCNVAQPAKCVLCDVTLDPSQTEPLLELERSGVILPRDVRCCSGHGAQGRLQLRERRRVEPPELAAEE